MAGGKKETSSQKLLKKLIPPYKEISLREEQIECINAIMAEPKGTSMLVVMATGLGKTATFTHLPRKGKMLIVAAGKEVVLNPLGYFDCEVGVEMGTFHAKKDFPDAEVICASAPSLAKRLDEYDPEEFETIIIDEAHHSTAKTYLEIIKYFKPDRLVGFTATPKRTDGVGLNKVYSKIVFNRDLKWAISEGKLSDIYSRSVKIDVDLRNVRKTTNQNGDMDYNAADLARAMSKSPPFIKDIYNQYAFGPTLIFVASVEIAHEVEELIPGCISITGDMDETSRNTILEEFRAGNVPCIVSVGVLKEGVDLPNVLTVIMARPTLSSILYSQMVGRGTRLYPGKAYLNLINVEGILGKGVQLCCPATLMGIDLRLVPPADQNKFNDAKVSDMERIANDIMDTPESWATNAEAVELWADTSGYDLHDVAWFLYPDGHLELTFPDKSRTQLRMTIPAPDMLGRTVIGHTRMPVQMALDRARDKLDRQYSDSARMWDTQAMKNSWGMKPITPKQEYRIHNMYPDVDTAGMTSLQASRIISRMEATEAGVEDDMKEIFLVPPNGKPKKFFSCETIEVDDEPVVVYDFNPGDEYIVAPQEKDFRAVYLQWIENSVLATYKKENNDLDKTIARINRRAKITFAKVFLKAHKEYRYICAFGKSPITRKDLTTWMAKEADVAIPRIIKARIVEPTTSPISKARPKMDEAPYNTIRFDYPESAEVASGKRISMSAETKAIKQKQMEQWAEKQKKEYENRSAASSE